MNPTRMSTSAAVFPGLCRGLVCLALLLLTSALSLAQSQPSAPQGEQVDQNIPTFKVDVKLVNVLVSVTDPKGAPVAGLTKDDFQLMEDGLPQKIAVFGRESQLPLSVVLSVDSSLSTRRDLPLELESARRFVHSLLRPVDRLSVYKFSEIVEEVVPFTANLKTVDRGLTGIKAGSATALYDAVYLAADALESRQGRKVMVVITDGGDTVSKMDYQDALRAAQQAEALIYSIIIVPIEASAGRDLGGEHALIQLSHDTGGRHYYASSIKSLDTAFEQISEELRTQYLLAYYPSRRVADSDFRRIEVQVHGGAESPQLRPRYRAGYFTSKFR